MCFPSVHLDRKGQRIYVDPVSFDTLQRNAQRSTKRLIGHRPTQTTTFKPMDSPALEFHSEALSAADPGWTVQDLKTLAYSFL